MSVSYKKPWNMLHDRDIKSDLKERTNLSDHTMKWLFHYENVNLSLVTQKGKNYG